MRTRMICLAAVLAAILGVAGHSAAAPIPEYFKGAHTSVLCASAQVPSLGTISVLVQINFGESSAGVIDLATADSLFGQLTGLLPILGSILGPNVVHINCSFGPSAMQSNFGFDAFELTDAVSPNFESYGFSLYVVLDSYYWVEPSFLGSAETLRVDAFIVTGANDLTYVASVSLLRP